jgi:hypothetical protein
MRLLVRFEARGSFMAGTMKQARDAAVESLARDLGITGEEAEGWCDAWEHFAGRRGGAESLYFWDAARGWIDAQRAMGRVLASAKRPPVETKSTAAVPAVRRIDRAS